MEKIRKKRRRRKKPKRKALIIILLVIGLIVIIAALAWARSATYSPSERRQVTLPSTVSDTYTPPQPEQFLNTLILGVDEHGLGDLMIIFSVNLQEDLIVITSLSRNTYVSDQNWADPDAGRSQLTYASYTAENPTAEDYHTGAVTATYWVEHLLGITIHEYALFTYESFIELIDLIGGVDIHVDPAFANVRITHQGKNITLPTGSERLSGEQAFAYASYRGRGGQREPRIEEPGSTSGEGDRIRRNQKLLRAVYQQVRKMRLPEILDLAGIATKKVHTSISFWDISYLAPKLYKADFDQMMTIVIPGEVEQFAATDRGYGYYEYFHIDFAKADALLEGIGLK